MIDFNCFYQQIANGSLSHWLKTLPYQIDQWKNITKYKQFSNWEKIVEHLPKMIPTNLNLKNSVIAKNTYPLDSKEKQRITYLLKGLMPWRKGPFYIYDINIDCEWRSDWKWQRLLPYISPLTNKLVLDVGCGNGYYMWRMIGEKAKMVIGIDPTHLFLCQFAAIYKLIGNNQQIYLLPVGIEQLPPLAAFDTVFSMGVLYHRRSPLDHLYQLKNQLVPGGELLLESLVINGNKDECLIPNGRYAQMRNVYFIPSGNMLKIWLERCGFCDVHIVNYSTTSLQEQRKTKWMKSKSLVDFLNHSDVNLTIEGYPAPLRAIVVAKKDKHDHDNI